jgi:hypothetical protein
MDVRELRQQLLNCADGPLEAVMYDALGSSHPLTAAQLTAAWNKKSSS